MPCCVTLTGDIQGPTLQPCCLAEGQRPQSEPAGTPVTGAAPPAPPDLAWTDARLVTPNARADWHPDTSPRHAVTPPHTHLLFSVFLI
jgi:hypothetical protein